MREFIVYADEVTQTEVNVALTTNVIVRLFGSMGCVAFGVLVAPHGSRLCCWVPNGSFAEVGF